MLSCKTKTKKKKNRQRNTINFGYTFGVNLKKISKS